MTALAEACFEKVVVEKDFSPLSCPGHHPPSQIPAESAMEDFVWYYVFMNKLVFCSGNVEKFSNARLVCELYGIELEQAKLSIDEIQSEDGDAIIADKLDKAYAILKKPVIVSDDSWEISGLNGFPGPYMKSINHWFTAQDLLRLTSQLEDRSVFLIQRLGFKDGNISKIFTNKTKGTLLKEIKGEYGVASHKLISMGGDNGLTISEVYDKGLDKAEREIGGNWHELIAWYKNNQST